MMLFVIKRLLNIIVLLGKTTLLEEILNGNIKITSENGTKVFVTIPEIILNNK